MAADSDHHSSKYSERDLWQDHARGCDGGAGSGDQRDPRGAETIGAPARTREGSNRAVSLGMRSEEHTSELQSRFDLVCRLPLEKKKECAARALSTRRGRARRYAHKGASRPASDTRAPRQFPLRARIRGRLAVT